MRAAFGGDRGAHHAEQYEQVGGYLLGEGQRADAGPAADDVCKGDADHTTVQIMQIISSMESSILLNISHTSRQASMPKAAQASAPK